jgi:hypothetical protein
MINIFQRRRIVAVTGAAAAAVVLTLGAAAAIAALTLMPSAKHADPGPRHADPGPRHADPGTLTVGAGAPGRAIPAGFLGLSIEIPGIPQYASDDPAAPNPIFTQLLKNLTPGGRPVLRVGGDSTDWTWFPVRGVKQPGGIRYTLTPKWMAIARAVAQAANAHMIVGVNLEANSGRLAAGDAQAYINGLGRDHVDAIELGNEPELYSAFAWYKLPNGQKVYGRPPSSWDYPAFASNFASIARALPRGVPLAAPSIGGPAWRPKLGSFLRTQTNPRPAIATIHAYPLKRCRSSTHHTAGELLSTTSSAGLANSLAGFAATAHAHGIPLRIDEINSISCGGQPGLSDSFASSLWALDALYELARVGIDGVNIHTVPNATNEPFYFNHLGGGWRGAVRPLYYGMLMFAHAAPAGARIVRVSGQTLAALRVWSTRATDGTVRTVLINDGSAAHTVRIRAPGTRGAPAVLEQLRAPRLTALSGITIGGQSFGVRTTTGVLAGRPNAPTVRPVAGTYTVSLPPASATLLTVPR